MTTRKPHRWSLAFAAALLLGAAPLVWAKWEKEQVAFENDLTQRIESILSKTLPPNSYLVTVKVEMTDSGPGGIQRRVNTRSGENPFLQKNRFLLPGVPEKKEFSTPTPVTEENIANQPIETLVKKISISVLVSPEVSTDQIRSLREFIGSAVPFNPLRGDELDIQASPLLKAAAVGSAPTAPAASTFAASGGGRMDQMSNRSALMLMALLVLIGVGLFGLTVFLFGPVRGFFNRLLAVLPRVGEQAMYAANANSGQSAAARAAALPAYSGPMGGGNNDNGPKLNMPFQFIREDQLTKLAMLFRELSSSEAALILAYLPAPWASRLLSGVDAGTQAAITRELSRSREVPAETVNQVEAQIREKLPYMVGGMEWIQSVFPLTQPQIQRVLLNTLSQESPALAKALRQQTFFFEDLGLLPPPAVRALVQELGYPQVALALKDEKKELQQAVIARVPAGIRGILQQELELSSNDKTSITDAKNRLVETARRLMTEGRITLGAAQ